MAFKIVFGLVALVTMVATRAVEPGHSHVSVHLYPTKEHSVVIPSHHGSAEGHGHEGGSSSGHHHVEYFAPAHYSFEYSVHDEHTGDIKEQKETREGDKVQGYYTLKEADGTRRIVHYTADKHSGFNAVVTHEGKAVHAAPVAHHGHHGHQAASAGGHHNGGVESGAHHGASATSFAHVSAPAHHAVPVVHGGHADAGAAHSHHGTVFAHHTSALSHQAGHAVATHITHIVPEHHHSH